MLCAGLLLYALLFISFYSHVIYLLSDGIIKKEGCIKKILLIKEFIFVLLFI
jgi:hypothetical protein